MSKKKIVVEEARWMNGNLCHKGGWVDSIGRLCGPWTFYDEDESINFRGFLELGRRKGLFYEKRYDRELSRKKKESVFGFIFVCLKTFYFFLRISNKKI